MPRRSGFHRFATGWALFGARPRARARISHALLWILLFSTLHGFLGALLVPTLASGPVTEVCTPQGMQWVSADRALDSEDAPVPLQGLASPCVWCMAHVPVPVSPAGRQLRHTVAAPQVLVGRLGLDATHSSDRTDRVLLNAPMRAPPPRRG